MSVAQFAPWTQARGRCAPSAKRGSRALLRAILGRWHSGRTESWGILSCRDTALGNKSAHAKGRAIDVGCSVRVGRNIRKRIMRVGPARLGVSVIIHDRVIYSRRSPAGRRYNGHPHRDHIHIEMTPKAAKRLNFRTVKRILNQR